MLQIFQCALFDAKNATQNMIKNFVYELQQLNKARNMQETKKGSYLKKYNSKLETIFEE